jgi:hypothetical protein
VRTALTLRDFQQSHAPSLLWGVSYEEKSDDCRPPCHSYTRDMLWGASSVRNALTRLSIKPCSEFALGASSVKVP